MSNTTETPREKRYRNCLEDIQRMTETRICDLEDIGCEDTAEFDTLCKLQRRINRTLCVREITSKQFMKKLQEHGPGN